MKGIKLVKASLTFSSPSTHFPMRLKSLWYDANGGFWKSVYLYARAKKVRPFSTLEEEWEELVNHFTA